MPRIGNLFSAATRRRDIRTVRRSASSRTEGRCSREKVDLDSGKTTATWVARSKTKPLLRSLPPSHPLSSRHSLRPFGLRAGFSRHWNAVFRPLSFRAVFEIVCPPCPLLGCGREGAAPSAPGEAKRNMSRGHRRTTSNKRRVGLPGKKEIPCFRAKRPPCAKGQNLAYAPSEPVVSPFAARTEPRPPPWGTAWLRDLQIRSRILEG